MSFIDAIGNIVGKGELARGTRTINLSGIDVSSGVSTSIDTSGTDPAAGDELLGDSELVADSGEVALNIPDLVSVDEVSDVRVSTSVSDGGVDATEYDFDEAEEIIQDGGDTGVIGAEVATFDADESPSTPDGEYEEGDKKIDGNIVVVQIYESDADSASLEDAGTDSASYDPLAVQVQAEGY